MCGICGIVDFAATGIDEGVVRAMADTLHHRGPDSTGVHVEGPAGLGHTRLAILDLTVTGAQPMHDGDVSMVYNGELYNQLELRDELEHRGHRFRGRSDSEVLLSAFREWGPEAFPRMNGMVAAAFWNRAQRSLTLVRDRFGIKPLYYYHDGKRLIFASEIKAILEVPGVERRVNMEALHEYLYFGTGLGEHTLYQGIRKLLPGHSLRFDESGLTTAAFWHVGLIRPVTMNDDEATELAREKLEAAVSSHLMSDVPVGLFLSGGIDSSTLAVMASRHYQGRLQTYSAGFDFDIGGVDELPQARRLAEKLGTEHHEIRIDGKDVGRVVERLIECHDQPFCDAANIPLYLLCEQLKGSVKVILQGDGGDEIFAGYRRYELLERAGLWRTAGRLLTPLLAALPRKRQSVYRILRLLRAMGQRDPALRMASLMTWEHIGLPPQVLSADARPAVLEQDAFARYRAVEQRVAALDPVQKMLYTDLCIHLPDVFLEKVDKPTMAHSIEVRVPFLDTGLADAVIPLSARQKLRNGDKKWLLKRALRGLVPDNILDAPKKGFDVPMPHWLREAQAGFLSEVVMDEQNLAWGLFDHKNLTRFMDEHTTGRRDHGHLLYKVLQLSLWRRAYGIAG